jgi:quinone-modifying oxidoreductase subunit QmoC
MWVVTMRINPLVRGEFIYPLSFWSPWKMLANVGGIALVVGCAVMLYERWKHRERPVGSSFFDMALLWTLLAVAVTGLLTEALHFARLEPHRHAMYFVHLVCAFALLLYLPYSKLAHLVYRTTALVYAEHTGRSGPKAATADVESGREEAKDAEDAR